MNCVIEGNCVKALGKAIHALSRIGDELWLDPMVKGLALRSVNSAQSAYGCFLFSPLFFQQYSLGSVSQQGSGAIKCKLLMKSVLPLFRCLSSIERSVERCHLSVSTATDRVMIQFFCRHGIIKTHNIHFQESEALQAVFASHLCPNVLKAPARLLADMVIHFPLFQEEITLSITPMKVTLRNYQEDGKAPMKTTYTEMSLHPDEFDYVQIGLDSDITFCLKELRLFSPNVLECLLSSPLGDSSLASLNLSFLSVFDNLPWTGEKRLRVLVSHRNLVLCRVSQPSSVVYLDAAGKPVCFSVEDTVLEATVLLATLVDSESRDRSQPTEPLTPTTPRSAQPVDVFEGASSMHHHIPDELVASSQGSPVISSPKQTHLYPQMIGSTCLGVPSATTSPASTKICSLLFKALSSEQHDGGCASQLPVLACYSDEENTDDNNPRSPSL